MTSRPVQYFSDEYLQSSKKMKPDQILEFLDSYRQLQMPVSKSKLISIKIPENLLETFKQKSQQMGVKYQTQIKSLMLDWLKN